MPTGRQKVSKAATLCVSKRYSRHGKSRPKSGTMAPMTAAESSRQRANSRDKGSTTAAWDMVNGINKPWLSSQRHLRVTLQIYKLEVGSQSLPGVQHVEYRCDQSSAPANGAYGGVDADRAKA